ncbi:MAG TPA: acyltransferase [Usitatibacter sp.]|jgi:peptidoglycan/LPS O-acetylase OafA/YrhL|nr:acyltransferase [Usitatibacter sp.]
MLLAAHQASDEHRVAALDRLRAFAVFLVIGHHAAWRFRPDGADPLAQVMKGAGWIGVDIFFVISGFMITAILLRDGGDIRGFFVRRFYRIVPLFVVAVAVFAALAAATGLGAEKLGLIWSPALLLNGWTIPFLGYGKVPYTITWSLSVEEAAYLAMGLACLAGRKGLIATLAAFMVIGPVTRVVALATGAIDPFELYFFVPARLDTIAFGGLAALLAQRGARARPWMAWIAGLAVVVLIVAYRYLSVAMPAMVLAGYSVFGLATGWFVFSLATLDAARGEGTGRAARAASFVSRGVGSITARFGRVSYFIYLFHIFVLEALLQAQRWFPTARLGYWQALALATAIVFGLAVLSWRWFERPLIRRGRDVSLGGRKQNVLRADDRGVSAS